MSNDANVTSTPNAGTSDDVRLTGRVKWFNNRAGFGFVTVLEGDKKDEDIFVHHSGIVVGSEQYKYLVQGEYVWFSLRESDNEEHPYQAGTVHGWGDGMLMCETRHANRSQRSNEDDDEDNGDNRRRQRNNNNRRGGPRSSGPRSSGPRRGPPNDGETEGGSEEWVLQRRSRNNNRGGRRAPERT